MILTEQEKNDIKSQYESDEISNDVMIHLRRHYPLKEVQIGNHLIKYLYIDDKMRPLIDNKKSLTNKLYWEVLDKFKGISEPILRRTIKRYLTIIGG